MKMSYCFFQLELTVPVLPSSIVSISIPVVESGNISLGFTIWSCFIR
jgi:hypothetical protein